jgi:Putative prokaryotic signal transducing protein
MVIDNEWADVRCTWLDEARWCRSVLEAAGIETRIPDEHTLGLPLTDEAGPESVRVLVRAGDLERALELLDKADRGRDIPT